MMKNEIEVAQLEEVFSADDADFVLLGNMEAATVNLVVGRMVTEASGNLQFDPIAAVAATRVGYISVDAITRSGHARDLGLHSDGSSLQTH